jgi:hypothetical protein
MTTPTSNQVQKPPIRLRVYRRTQELISLLWDTKGLTQNQRDHIIISVEDEEQGVARYRPVKYGTASGEGIRLEIAETDMALVRHEENKMSAAEDYWFKVIFGADDVPADQLEARIKVHSYGVLPPYEKDDSRKNEHMYGYSTARRKWFKMPLVEHNGIMGIPVVILNPEEIKDGKRRVMLSPLVREERNNGNAGSEESA